MFSNKQNLLSYILCGYILGCLYTMLISDADPISKYYVSNISLLQLVIPTIAFSATLCLITVLFAGRSAQNVSYYTTATRKVKHYFQNCSTKKCSKFQALRTGAFGPEYGTIKADRPACMPPGE